jgi:hypothetical protein
MSEIVLTGSGGSSMMGVGSEREKAEAHAETVLEGLEK